VILGEPDMTRPILEKNDDPKKKKASIPNP